MPTHRPNRVNRSLAALLAAGVLACSPAMALGQASGPAVFVANNGNLVGSVTSWRMNADGTLEFADQVDTDTNAVSLAISPSGRYLAVGRAEGMVTVQDLIIIAVEADATMAQVAITQTPTTPLDLVWVSDSIVAVTRSQFGSSSVLTYRFDEEGLTLVDTEPSGSFNTGLAFDRTRGLLYANDSTGFLIRRFAVDETGEMTLVGTTPTSPVYPLSPALSPDAQLLYTGGGISNGGNKIGGFTITAGGDLLPAGSQPFVSPGASPAYAAVSGDGQFLIMGHGTDATVRTFAIDPESGGLTYTGFVFDVGLQGSIGDVATMGGRVLVTDDTSALDGVTGLYVFDLNADGSLTQVGPVYSSGAVAPECIAVWMPEAACPGDVTGDGAVDLLDLNLVLGNFGQATGEGDADGSGGVDLLDLNLVLGNFGIACG